MASAHYLPGLNATSGTTAPPAFAYEYNLGGLLTKLTYPSGRVVEYTTTVANRVATVKRNAAQNYLSSAGYSAAGELTAAAFGVSAYTQSWSYNALTRGSVSRGSVSRGSVSKTLLPRSRDERAVRC